jgi:hypothetical protein
MPSFFSASSLCLGVAADAIALVASRRGGREQSLLAQLPLDTALAYPAALAAGLKTLFEGAAQVRARSPLAVVLADDVCRLWQVAPPPGCSRLGDLEAAAGLRFQQLYGEPAAPWQLSGDWQLARPFIAAAVPRSVLAAVQHGAEAHALPLVEMAPQFIARFNRHRHDIDPGDWLGVVHDGVLTLGVCQDGALCAVRALGLAEHAGENDLQHLLAREALRLTVAPPTRLLLCGDAVPAWRGVAASATATVIAWLEQGMHADWPPAARLAAAGGRP